MAAGTGFAADSVLPDCVSPATTIVFGVSLRSLMASPVLKSFQSDMRKMSVDLLKSGPLPVSETANSGPSQGFDPFQDVDDMIIASTSVKDNATSLIVLHGRFDPKRLPGTSTSYNGVSIFGDSKKANGAIAVLDETTAIVGDMAEVRAAIDRRGTPSRIKPALAAKVRSMAGHFDFWGVGDLPEGYQPAPGTVDGLGSIDHFEFSASLHQGLEINGEIHARTAQDADKMAESMKMIEAMLKSTPSSTNGTKIDLQSAKGTIKLSLMVSEEDLKKGIEAQKAGFAAATNARLQPTKPATPKRAEIVKDDHGDTVKVTLPGGH